MLSNKERNIITSSWDPIDLFNSVAFPAAALWLGFKHGLLKLKDGVGLSTLQTSERIQDRELAIMLTTCSDEAALLGKYGELSLYKTNEKKWVEYQFELPPNSKVQFRMGLMEVGTISQFYKNLNADVDFARSRDVQETKSNGLDSLFDLGEPREAGRYELEVYVEYISQYLDLFGYKFKNLIEWSTKVKSQSIPVSKSLRISGYEEKSPDFY